MISRLLFLLVLLPLNIFAAQFIVNVDSTEIADTQSLKISYELIDAKPLDQPDFSALLENFEIFRQHKMMTYKNYNGVSSSTHSWELIVLPQTTGNLTIPAISVRTKSGKITSNSLNVNVVAGTKAISAPPKHTQPESTQPIILELAANVQKVMVNESFILKLNLFSSVNMLNLELEDIKCENAIIQRLDQSQQYTKFINGTNYNVTEISYIITPIKSGEIVIHPATITAEIAPSFFSRLAYGKPIKVSSNEFSIQAEAVPGGLYPFANLQVIDTIDKEEITEGEGLERRISLQADRGFVTNITSFDSMQHQDFKIYTDKSEPVEKIIDAKVRSSKTVNLTLIPTKVGEIELPEYTIEWWDLEHKKARKSVIPGKKINVSPAAAEEEALSEEPIAIVTEKIGRLNYKISNTLVALLLISVIANILLLIKIFKIPAKLKTNSYKDIEVKDMQSLVTYIKAYANAKWGITKNFPVGDLTNILRSKNYYFDKKLANKIINKINANNYSNKTADYQEILTEWQKFSRTVIKAEDKSVDNKLDIDLNL